MPKAAPKEGYCHVIVAIKGQRTRYEMVTQLTADDAAKALQTIAQLATHQPTKEAEKP